MKERLLRRDYEKNGVAVTVEIDFIKKEISLVETGGTNKRWLFAKRGVEYMQGWRNILNAMEYAIDEAEKKYPEIDFEIV